LGSRPRGFESRILRWSGKGRWKLVTLDLRLRIRSWPQFWSQLTRGHHASVPQQAIYSTRNLPPNWVSDVLITRRHRGAGPGHEVQCTSGQEAVLDAEDPHTWASARPAAMASSAKSNPVNLLAG
jgi:hypothetical protein